MSSSRTVSLIFPWGSFLLAVLAVIFLAGVILTARDVAFRKPIGASLSAIGIIEILPFLLLNLGFNDISLLIPLTPLMIIFAEGCITLVGGVFVLNLPKPGSGNEPKE